MTAGSPESDPPLPELHEALLDDGLLDALVADIDAHCDLESLRARAAPSARTDPPTNLAEARDRLRRGEIAALQLRYRHGEDRWLDTITPASGGYRLIRLRDPLHPA
jgi:hypothetical protein